MSELRADATRRTLFLYWGRRGLSRLTYDLAAELEASGRRDWLLSVSEQNEVFHLFRRFDDRLLPITTFNHGIGGFVGLHRLLYLRHAFVRRAKALGVDTVVNLMPHLWSPLVAPRIRAAGMRYVTIVHDADPHPGDPTSVLHGWGLRDILYSNKVVTLSQTVAGRLSATGRVRHGQLVPLFHPDLSFGAPVQPRPPADGEPFRLLFFGRILPYKGLALLSDALEVLAEQNVHLELGVYGEGPVGEIRERLTALGARIHNGWVADSQVADVFRGYHAVVLPHTEASQSGVAATALGMGLPIVACPVGGLIEQVRHGETGVLAETADAVGLARAIHGLCADAQLYETLCGRIERGRPRRSMRAFVDSLEGAIHQPSAFAPSR